MLDTPPTNLAWLSFFLPSESLQVLHYEIFPSELIVVGEVAYARVVGKQGRPVGFAHPSDVRPVVVPTRLLARLQPALRQQHVQDGVDKVGLERVHFPRDANGWSSSPCPAVNHDEPKDERMRGIIRRVVHPVAARLVRL